MGSSGCVTAWVADDGGFPVYSKRWNLLPACNWLCMGIHDREYYRNETREPSALSQWSMVTKLIVITVAVHLLVFVDSSQWLKEHLAATPDSLKKPYLWWQLLTYGFTHDQHSVMHIFWNMFGLWCFGRQVEDLYGPKEFLRIYLVSILLGGIVWAARASLFGGGGGLVGASGAVVAVTLLFCIHYPKQTVLLMMVLPVPAWVLGVIIIGGNLFEMQFSSANIAFDVHLVGAAFAIVYYRFGWNLGRWLPSFSLPTGTNLFKRRPKLKVHHPRDDAGEEFEQLEARADELLQKVNRDGVDSLTAKERKILEDYSRRVRNKRG
jgi:membrane associated rhomboid family serine protease